MLNDAALEDNLNIDFVEISFVGIRFILLDL